MIIKKDVADMLLMMSEKNPYRFNSIMTSILRYASNETELNDDDMDCREQFWWNMVKSLISFDNRNAEQTKKD